MKNSVKSRRTTDIGLTNRNDVDEHPSFSWESFMSFVSYFGCEFHAL